MQRSGQASFGLLVKSSRPWQLALPKLHLCEVFFEANPENESGCWNGSDNSLHCSGLASF